jgi:hypothetical protein
MDAGHEGAVDLDLVEAEVAEIAQRRIAGAEIIERDLEAQRAHLNRKSGGCGPTIPSTRLR